jgi:hypothetical protein
MANGGTGTQKGLSRRDLIKKGAVAGGVTIWAAPVIESFAFGAEAASQPCAGVGGISFVAVLLNCNGTCTEAKIEGSQTTCFTPNAPPPNGPAVPCCTPFTLTELAGCSSFSSTCPSGFSGSQSETSGTVTVPSGCTLQAFRVHCGQCCECEGNPCQPSTQTGPTTVTFHQCQGTGSGPNPCMPPAGQPGNCSAPCPHPSCNHTEDLFTGVVLTQTC